MKINKDEAAILAKALNAYIGELNDHPGLDNSSRHFFNRALSELFLKLKTESSDKRVSKEIDPFYFTIIRYARNFKKKHS